MGEFDKIQEALNYIAEKGDLLDVISEKDNVDATKKSIIKLNLLLFSRILFLGTLIGEKIKKKFAPIEKVREAQEVVRDYLGVKVDIVRGKDIDHSYVSKKENLEPRDIVIEKIYENIKASIWHDSPFLKILYVDHNIEPDEYLENLKKIMTFCSVYNINTVYLGSDYIVENYGDTCIAEFNDRLLVRVFNRLNDDFSDEMIITLHLDDLNNLIAILETLSDDKRQILALGQNIEDKAINRALLAYAETGNRKRLETVVRSRLILNLNSDSAYRDRVLGKVNESIELNGEYVKITPITNEGAGTPIVISLYDFLGIKSFGELINYERCEDGQEDIYAISALYLFLLDKKKNKYEKTWNDTDSIYDEVYKEYKEKSKYSRKENTYDTFEIFWSRFFNYIVALAVSLVFFFSLLLGSGLIEFINFMVIKDADKDYINDFLTSFFTPYEYSLDFEKSLINDFMRYAQDLALENDVIISGNTGDAKSFLFDSNKIKPIGWISTFDDFEMPEYFACTYGESASYSFGKVNYDLKEVPVDFKKISETKSLFAILTKLNRSKVRKMIEGNYLNVNTYLYPVGGDYAITSILIRDSADKSKNVYIDYERASLYGNYISDKEISILKSMKNPEIVYYYGIDHYRDNNFVSGIQRESYSSLDSSQLREIMISSLGLSADASFGDIYNSIKSKYYSLTPLKDADLNFKIKFMNEENYYSTIASMDSLICNMAANLTSVVDDDFVYIIGFYNYDDSVLTLDEAHAWNMTKEGYIIDSTPAFENLDKSKNDKEGIGDMINAVFKWAADNNLSLMITIGSASLLAAMIFGKLIVFEFRKSQIEKLLSDPNFGHGFSNINNFLYGGINLPTEYTDEEIVKKMTTDYAAYTDEELKLIRERISKSSFSCEEIKQAQGILKNVPFVRDNEEDLIRSLRKSREKKLKKQKKL